MALLFLASAGPQVRPTVVRWQDEEGQEACKSCPAGRYLQGAGAGMFATESCSDMSQCPTVDHCKLIKCRLKTVGDKKFIQVIHNNKESTGVHHCKMYEDYTTGTFQCACSCAAVEDWDAHNALLGGIFAQAGHNAAVGGR